MSSDKSRQVLQYWVGDSHLARHHHLPTQYSLAINTNQQDHQRFLTAPDLTNVRGGRTFTNKEGDERWWEDFCEKTIPELADTPRCFIVSCGSNDLRRASHWDCKEDVLYHFEKIIDAIYKTSNAALVVISPIPDNTGRTDDLGDALDRELQQLCWGAHPRVKYVPLRSKKLEFQNNRNSRWSSMNFADEVHLNSNGARLLAEAILGQQKNLINEIFGFESEAPSAAKRRRVMSLGPNIIQPRDLQLPRLRTEEEALARRDQAANSNQQRKAGFSRRRD
jgi:lysophospholipase L1-like esterase